MIYSYRFAFTEENDKLLQTALALTCLTLVLKARNCLSVSELIVDVYLFYFLSDSGGRMRHLYPKSHNDNSTGERPNINHLL